MAFTETTQPFFADFGVDATLAGQAVRVIFDADYQSDGMGARGMAGANPAATVATSNVPSSPYGAALVVPGRGAFTVTEHRPDGTGISLLLLERAA